MKTKNDENNYKSGFFLLVFSVSKNSSSEMNPCYMLNISALWGFYPISRIFSFFFSLGKLIHAKNHLLPIGGQHSHITTPVSFQGLRLMFPCPRHLILHFSRTSLFT